MRKHPMKLEAGRLAPAVLAACLLACGEKPTVVAPPSPDAPKQGEVKPMGVKYAVIKTTKGDILCKLHGDKVPKTVGNFIGLATGSKQWVDPRDGQTKSAPLYRKILFHRVIPGFMAQTGDPMGDGRGGPGYTFEDEFDPALRFDKPGILGMANRGPATNGSQFFITVAPTPHLNDRHTVFGEVVKGQEIVDSITQAPRSQDGFDRPVEPIYMESVEIKDQP